MAIVGKTESLSCFFTSLCNKYNVDGLLSLCLSQFPFIYLYNILFFTRISVLTKFITLDARTINKLDPIAAK